MLTLGLTTYRPETIPLAEDLMATADSVWLEEPQTPGLAEMLAGELDIDTYLQLTDYGFARYAQDQCRLLRRLAAKGIAIRQVDPFMDELVRIHEFFAAGGAPEQIQEATTRAVYEAEREWTRRLLAFYRASAEAGFDRIVATVQAFARADAARGRLRDSMRATVLCEHVDSGQAVYVEAGYIHFSLVHELLRRGVRPRIRFVLEPVYRRLCGRRQAVAPGDILTWWYLFHPRATGRRLDRLAAQALVYNKIVAKEELPTEQGQYPHAADEVRAIGLVHGLEYDACQEVFQQIRALPTDTARQYLETQGTG